MVVAVVKGLKESGSQEVILPLYTAVARPPLKDCVQFRVSHSEKDKLEEGNYDGDGPGNKVLQGTL